MRALTLCLLSVAACGDNLVATDTDAPSAPIVTIVPPLIPMRTSNVRPTVSFVVDAGAAEIECASDGAAFAPCTASFTAAADLAEGTHTYRVRAIDRAGTPTLVEVAFVVDTTPPALALTTAPADPSGDPTPTFEFTVGADATAVRCSLDAQIVEPCTSPVTFDDPLSPGDHTFTITASDDAVAPNVSIVAHPFAIALCGNGVIDGTEACDGADLGGATCVSQGFHTGALACSDTCTLDTRACFAAAATGFTGRVCLDGLKFPTPGNGLSPLACTEAGGVWRSTADAAPLWSATNGTGTPTQVVSNLNGRAIFAQPDGPSYLVLTDNSTPTNAFRSNNLNTWTQLAMASGGAPFDLFAARLGSAMNNIWGGWHPVLGAVVLHGNFLAPPAANVAISPVGAGVTGTVRSIATGANGATTDVLVAVHGQTPDGTAATGGGVYWTCDQLGIAGGTYVARDTGIAAADKPLVWSLTVDPASFTTTTRTCPSTGGTIGGYATVYYAALRGGGQVYKTSDGGETWAPSNTGLPAGAEVYAIAIDCFSTQNPIGAVRCADHESLYAATSLGLYHSADAGAHWTLAGFDGVAVRAVTLLLQRTTAAIPPRIFVGVDDATGIYQANPP